MEKCNQKSQHWIAIYRLGEWILCNVLVDIFYFASQYHKKHIHKNTALLPSMTPQVKPALWRLKYMNGVLMPSVTFHGEMSHSAAAAQQADSIKIGFLQRPMPCMQYATAFGYSPQGLAIKSAVFYHLKNVQQYSKGELGRLPHCLGIGAAHCLRSPLTTTTKKQPTTFRARL